MNRKFLKSIAALIVMQAFVLPSILLGQTADVNARIREAAGGKSSQVMNHLQVLTDVYGPRLTGSPNHKASAEWVVKQMKEWGFDKAELEAWDFGHPGWITERSAGFITAPVKDSLVFEVLAWTPSTNGVVAGTAVRLDLPSRPTQAELTTYFNQVRASLKGNMVLVGRPQSVPVQIEPPAKRINDEELKRRLDPNAAPQPMQRPTMQPREPKEGELTFGQLSEQLDKFLIDAGVAVRINDAGREHGQIRAFNNRTFDVTKTVPTVVLRNEDYGRISRLIDGKHKVELEFDIRNKVIPEGTTSYNVVGEITGTDKKDEVIMLGGHLDSWHAATGATDNATGCSIMLEAMRTIKALGLKPRRTIRIALWSGEEQGLLGSQAYVKKHFGTAENPTAAWSKFGGYFNHDTGTGRIRAMSVFGPPETAAALREILAPFEDLGFMGVMSTASRGLGGSDHTSFNAAGLPGIGTMLDPIEYGTHTWHTNLDTYERVIESDLKQGVTIIAAAAYALAMRDELLPRFSAETMPKPPEPRR